ncbi:hypothetical protein Q7C36_008040 [Tachysurus vachellii]|uniref:Uncharacterized protein n=1 Tax=Tachysurus vachellii TaxID=175792 RepID=A0AA88SWA7_TACVA|nr:hypothetical protein Q7C36_008040 [Tachysurus vachellii]
MPSPQSRGAMPQGATPPPLNRSNLQDRIEEGSEYEGETTKGGEVNHQMFLSSATLAAAALDHRNLTNPNPVTLVRLSRLTQSTAVAFASAKELCAPRVPDSR